jgi:hypothetical protein
MRLARRASISLLSYQIRVAPALHRSVAGVFKDISRYVQELWRPRSILNLIELATLRITPRRSPPR